MVAGLVVTLAVPRTLDGAAVAAAPAEATEDPYPDVVPLATTPTPRWTVSMSDIDVPADTQDAKSRRPAVLAANTSIVVGGPRQVTETALDGIRRQDREEEVAEGVGLPCGGVRLQP
ncbi:hypothetical protein [Gordonia paraffinivorans]|uniref:hypothetical protein n=1 Tax=Gordonia paraffinivorans TaxID=175628 RepID=UPI003FCC95DB